MKKVTKIKSLPKAIGVFFLSLIVSISTSTIKTPVKAEEIIEFSIDEVIASLTFDQWEKIQILNESFGDFMVGRDIQVK